MTITTILIGLALLILTIPFVVGPLLRSLISVNRSWWRYVTWILTIRSGR